MNVFLIGYRCSGKSAVGAELSQRIGWRFLDTDNLLVEAAGKSIKEIVEEKGWQTFRRMERVLLERVLSRDFSVIATGGGIVIDPDNVRQMKASGTVVWLRATAETIKSRMQDDVSTDDFRPSLSEKGTVEEIEEVLAERQPLYEKSMDFFMHTDKISVEMVCNGILRKLRLMGVELGTPPS